MPIFGTANHLARSIEARMRFQSPEVCRGAVGGVAGERPFAGKTGERALRQRPAQLGRAQQQIERGRPVLGHADALARVERHQVHGFCAERSFHG